MDASTLSFAILTATLAGVACHACRQGNEERDAAPLGVSSGPRGAGTAVTTNL